MRCKGGRRLREYRIDTNTRESGPVRLYLPLQCGDTVLYELGDTPVGAYQDVGDCVGVPGRIRTCDPLLRRQPLYPLSYRDVYVYGTRSV